jgi:hypothetical protein
MRHDTLLGLIGAIFGMCAAGFIILSADSPVIELSGVQVALFSALGLGGAGLVKREPSFGGWMMIASALFLIVTAPGSVSPVIPLSYLPAIIAFGIGGIMAVRSAREEQAESGSAE